MEFATRGQESQCSVTEAQVKVLMENIQELDVRAFSTDRQLFCELVNLKVSTKKPLGLILVSGNEKCIQCGNKLQLRKDRPSSVVIYDEKMGTIPGSHYHKTCSNTILWLHDRKPFIRSEVQPQLGVASVLCLI